MKRLAILGASGHGKVVADTAGLAGWDTVVFYDERWPDVTSVGPWPIAGRMADLVEASTSFEGVVVAIGDNAVRLRLIRQLAAHGLALPAVIHPAASVSAHAAVGSGTVVFAGAVVNAFATIGAGCIINTAATVDHDCVLADGVHVSPGAHLGGGVHLGESAWIGIGASVKQGVAIGATAVVGAGAAVIADIPDGAVVGGVPARVLRQSATPMPPDADAS